MAAQTVTIALDNGTDAQFRAWGKAISDQMALGGWTKGTDSGQIDWATVLKPASGNVSQGYEVWRSNDAGGGLVNIFVKIEYGSQSTAGNPGIWITVGFASDGAGNLTGVVSTRRQVYGGSQTSGTAVANNLAAGSGYACMVLGTGYSSGVGFAFNIERLRDASLNLTNEIAVIWHSNQIASVCQVVTPTFAYTLEGTAFKIMPTAANSNVSGNVGLGLMFVQKAGLMPISNFFGANGSQLGVAQSVVSITVAGVARSYIVNAFVSSTGTGYSFQFGSDPLISRFD